MGRCRRGVLRYRRQKTGELAIVQLPSHVIALLRSVPLEQDSVGADMSFRVKGCDAHSDTITWRQRLTKLFALAGITEARTERGNVRKAHPHMLRDTFAVWNLVHGASLHEVAKMLGHSNTATTEKSYLPWVKELEVFHIAHVRAILEQAAPKPSGKVVAIRA